MQTSHIVDTLLGVGSLVVSGINVLAQIDPTTGSIFTGALTQFGGLGLAVWLAYHNTTVVIPNLQKSFKEERLEIQRMHNEELERKRVDFKEQINQQQIYHNEQLEELISRSICKFSTSENNSSKS